MEYCKKCGQALQNSDQFCGVCGAVVEADGENAARDGNPGICSDAPHILNKSQTTATSTTELLNGPESNHISGPLFSSDTNPARAPKPNIGHKTKIIIGALLAIVLAGGGFWGWLGYSSEARVQAKLELAIKYLNENDYEKAILEFNEAIRIDPRNIEARVGLAQAYIGIGDTQKADEVLTAAMNIGTLSPGQYQQVIEMYMKKGNYDEAAKLLAQARGKYPDNEALKAVEQLIAEAKAKAEAINSPPPVEQPAEPEPEPEPKPEKKTTVRKSNSGSVSNIY
ncbi:MAG: tetratricopeptide repeat protein [Syntrophomonas sp.]